MSPENPKRIIVVLGMHRSGTSAITRALVALGAQVGVNLITPGADNPKGFWEDRDFVLFNERLLALLDAGFDSLALLPEAFEQRPEIAELQLEAILLLRGKLADSDVFALKDPRTCRLLPFWQQVFAHMGATVDYVIAVRHPLSVAQSLSARNAFPQRKSLWLWLQHYIAAVKATHGMMRVFVDYDQLLAAPETQLQRIATALRLAGDDDLQIREYVGSFLSEDLRHTRFMPEDLRLIPDMPEVLVQAYSLLLSATAAGQGADFDAAWQPLATELRKQKGMLDFLQEYDRQAQALQQQLLQHERTLEAQRQEYEEALEAQRQGSEETLEAQRLGFEETLLAQRRRNEEALEAERQEYEEALEAQRQVWEALEEKLLEMERTLEAVHSASADENGRLNAQLRQIQHELQAVHGSRSMRITVPLRWAANRISHSSEYVKRLIRHPVGLRKVISHVRTFGIASALRRTKEVGRGVPADAAILPAARFNLHDHAQIYVLTTRHCLFVAELIVRQLARIGVKCGIIFERPIGGFVDVPHFVICPQMFPDLPGLYVAFQMEQTVSSRWLTPEYMRILENSFAILDYSSNNLAYFSANGLSQRQLNYMPIGWHPDYHSELSGRDDKEYDVLFYGDANNERRRQFISRIEEKYRVKVIGNLFGSKLYRELRKARVVINVHYYEGALLETTRLYECLSLGCLVVSETSVDIEQHRKLRNVVDFVEMGDADAMLARLDYWLTDEQAYRARLADNLELLRHQPNEFEYYFQRFLLASGNINFDQFYSLAGHNIQFSGNFVCLGLPESVERRADFDKDNIYGIEYFPGLRHPVGWIGCGMSYKFIMRKAAEQGLPWIIVCEDDVEFSPGWSERLSKVLTYLQSNPDKWDIFSGFIADLHVDTQVTNIVDQDGLELVHIDKMVSAVLNVYNSSFYQAILKWDETNHDVHSNAIDRYMENHAGIRVVTLHPFLIGHKEEQKSTLWGFDNTFYNGMIEQSTAALEKKILGYKRKVMASEKQELETV